MRLHRRAFTGSIVATLIAGLRPAGADEKTPPAPGDDGFTLLEARPGAVPLLPAPAAQTKIWGFGGDVPGPLLRVRLGQEIKARLINKLDQPTALHWRGMRIANEIDGAAGLVHKSLAPGESRDFRFTPPDAGTFFYQPLIQPFSGEQLGRGLQGVVIVDEPKPIFSDSELILVLDDWRLDAKGQIVPDFDHPADVLRQGRLGAVGSVNARAKPAPLTFAPGARLRLRLVNAATARIMSLYLPGGDLKAIALDGQFCDPFEPHDRTLPLGPGARCDLLLDLAPTENQSFKLILRGEAELPDLTLLEIRTKGAVRPPAPPIAAPPLNPLLPAEIRLEKSKRLDLVIAGGATRTTPSRYKPTGEALRRVWSINGRSSTGLDGPPLFSVKKGSPVTLGLVNKSLFAQAIHVQGHVVRLLHDLDDGWEPYWRDSVIVPPKRTKHIAFVADNPGKWLVASAILDHFANGLAAWFEVV
ncbi:multicopper oxidase family protein [Rhodoblastus acidophilus]|uniref:Multicopper oxidase family protein n=1 Tax=Candidatus Rhodoblastus alkanivorans TaxID=2954117 RepID=A0ABS9Z652_9HYPH|nr:multicopper oxidase family protein [Candidatus Rhodoblastus alkanivorans]MCI4678467.1 multicopper oxidase family protein [Candidatus Rhodoblastus alkanivorans]MCI4682860.1 multicopper oxidase family protein [Candidatus Rhodoblastus alkanivorans]MDI4640169.1 multicopper oxidase family protein [Rhodoblastus acidophilus]